MLATLFSPISTHFTVKIVDLLYECIMCSLSPCIKSTALRFKIPRESLHIPMDKRAQQLIDPIGISRRWFFKTCLLGLTYHQIYFSMRTCKMKLTCSTTSPNIEKVTHTHWQKISSKVKRLLDSIFCVKQEKIGISSHIRIIKQNILNSLNFLYKSWTFSYLDESWLGVFNNKYFITGNGVGLISLFYFTWNIENVHSK